MKSDLELSYVYSSATIPALKELIKSLDSTFSVKDKLDDMFWYGIFCNPETYAFYPNYCRCDGEVPALLMNEDVSPSEKMVFIKGEISKILKKEKPKPDYFFFVEEYLGFNEFEDAPSTFLYLLPKDNKYKKFAEALINFLYSPNLMTTLKSC